MVTKADTQLLAQLVSEENPAALTSQLPGTVLPEQAKCEECILMMHLS